MKVYTQLKIEERRTMFELHKNGASLRIISQVISRNKSTISRELKRNQYSDSVGYLPEHAALMAEKRKYRLESKLDRYPELKIYIKEKLQAGWGPDAISGRLELDGYRDVSAETIYQYVYSDEGKFLELYRYLASRNKARNQRHGRKARKPLIPERVSIHERSSEANERKETGHYEADLTFFKGNQSANIMVITERLTRYSIFIKNDSKDSLDVAKQLFNALASIPEEMLKSLTFDNGMEFSKHMLLRDFFDIKTFFCDPRSPWQKGQVEKTNAMLHKFIPKKSNLSTLDGKSLENLQHKFNNIPRKILGYKTPAELFTQNLQGVALHS